MPHRLSPTRLSWHSLVCPSTVCGLGLVPTPGWQAPAFGERGRLSRGPPVRFLSASTVLRVRLPSLLHPGSGPGVRCIFSIPGLHRAASCLASTAVTVRASLHTLRGLSAAALHHVAVTASLLPFAVTVSSVGSAPGPCSASGFGSLPSVAGLAASRPPWAFFPFEAIDASPRSRWPGLPPRSRVGWGSS
jgi:hypothetical protein